MARRVEVGTAFAPEITTPRLSRTVTVGALAAYLSHVEPHVDVPTLEVATRIPLGARLEEVDMAGGDRLLLTVREAKRAVFAAPPAPGDVLLRLEEGTYEVQSRGKRGLLVGTPEGGRAVPDVDLRRVVPDEWHGFLSRSALWLSYEGGVWHAARTGQTRVRLDDYEIGTGRVPLADGQRLTFYRASDDPATASSLGGLTVRLERVTSADTAPPLPDGTEVVDVGLALEVFRQTLRVSDMAPLDEVMTQLAAFNDVTLTPEAALWRLRLAPPSARITALELHSEQFLYAPYAAAPAGLHLHLRAVDVIDQVFTLKPDEQELVMGCRLQPAERIPSLNVDLHELFVARDAPPYSLGLRTPFLAYLRYSEGENVWRVRPAELGPMPIFVNTIRVGGEGVPLANGDVLTFGESLERYYARLEVATAME